MEIVNLPVGDQAPKDGDCISISQLPDGQFQLEGSALINCGDNDHVESVSMVDGGLYKTFDEAESAGLAWAASHCVERLYVSTAR